MGKLTLILGGARSGKSTYAEKLAIRNGGRVTFIATAQALDEEMQGRISAHRLKRPAAWRTYEIPMEVGSALVEHPTQAEVIILDCLTLLVANRVLEAAPDVDQPDEAHANSLVGREIDELLKAIHSSEAEWIVVSNEVGLGLVPPYPAGRIYRDLLGWANQRLAEVAVSVVFMIAGIPMRLEPTPE
jgi:adenosylcobinamide kinase / adenosylcobinamide-phosphate guanylyltransferase